jgi:hypothetical protein
MGAWQRRHLVSISAFREGVAATSAATTARHKGSAVEWAIIVDFQRSWGPTARLLASRNALADDAALWHIAHTLPVANCSEMMLAASVEMGDTC